ncbi:MAG: adenylate/guanylate cyclase domain-containing protein [Cyanobacteriota bacterium]|nr:adenylate/guanylate cyclase domain-containing protein [Cyanobacteriota bacterium]
MLGPINEAANDNDNNEFIFPPAEGDELIFAPEDGEVKFAEETNSNSPDISESWKILIVDDEPEVHNVTMFAFNDFKFEGKSLQFLSAYSGREAKELMEQNPDTAIIFLDVIMETDDAGLEVVKYIRDVLANKLVRIILRTGQPGQVPEDVVILDYDIDDYKTKTELTAKKLFSNVVTGLRAFRTLKSLETSTLELQKIAAASARFVPQEFLNFLQKESIVDARLGDSVEKEMTILFSDIRSFTSLSEAMSPKQNFDFINEYLSQMGPIIRQHKGFIDKYIGDAIMALFPNSADDALRAAIAMQKQVQLYNVYRNKSGLEPIAIGIGLHSGELMLGTVGEEERMESTVISDAVNVASRLEGLTKLYAVGIAISEQAMDKLKQRDIYHHRFLGKVQIKGKKVALGVFEIYEAEEPEAIALKTQTRRDFERAIELYQGRDIEQSCELFAKILKANPQDKATGVYVRRCERLQQYGTPEGWEPIETFEG